MGGSDDVDSVSGLLPRRDKASKDPELELKRPSLELWRCKRNRCCWEFWALKVVEDVEEEVRSVLSDSWPLEEGIIVKREQLKWTKNSDGEI